MLYPLSYPLLRNGEGLEPPTVCLENTNTCVFKRLTSPQGIILLKSCGFHEANCSINLSSTGSDRYLDAKLNRFWRMHFI